MTAPAEPKSEPPKDSAAPELPPVTLLQTIASVLASFFGVQNSRNRARDFQRGNPLLFIGVGVVLTVLFVLTLMMVVRLMLSQAGDS